MTPSIPTSPELYYKASARCLHRVAKQLLWLAAILSAVVVRRRLRRISRGGRIARRLKVLLNCSRKNSSLSGTEQRDQGKKMGRYFFGTERQIPIRELHSQREGTSGWGLLNMRRTFLRCQRSDQKLGAHRITLPQPDVPSISLHFSTLTQI